MFLGDVRNVHNIRVPPPPTAPIDTGAQVCRSLAQWSMEGACLVLYEVAWGPCIQAWASSALFGMALRRCPDPRMVLCPVYVHPPEQRREGALGSITDP
jgi:hypothetical protein